MTALEQVKHKLVYLISQYEEYKDDPTYKVKMSLLNAEYKALLKEKEDQETNR